MRTERALLQRGAVGFGEGDPVVDHLAVRRGSLSEHHGVLDRGEERVQNWTRRALRRLLWRPDEHVRVDGRLAGGEPQIADKLSYLVGIRRTVRRADHVSVLAYRRPHVLLAELEEDVGADRRKPSDDLLHERVDCNGNRADVASRISVLLGGIAPFRNLELVYEVELQSVESPVPHGANVCLHEIFAHLGEARIENADVRRAGVEELVLEPSPCGRLVADERNGEPE